MTTRRVPSRRAKNLSALLFSAAAVVVVALAMPALAPAATYVVDSTGDETDAAVGTDGCKTGLSTCTLRAAIEEANTSPEDDQITFGPAFDGKAVDTINLTSALPPITDAEVTIDGVSSPPCTTEAGASGPCVGVHGPAGGTTFQAEDEKITVEGIAITGSAVGLKATAAAPNFVAEGDWIGRKLDGAAAPVGTGIEVTERTTVSGNQIVGGQVGIHTSGADPSGGSSIKGNLIEGTQGAGILIENDLNRIGGNEVVGAGAAGIRIHSVTGVDANENVVGSDNRLAGPDVEENVIEDSAGDAIEINTVEKSGSDPSVNVVQRNRGGGNAGQFVDLVPLEPATEPKGPNNGVEPPQILEATGAKVSGTAEPEARVLVFLKLTAAPGEVESYIDYANAEPSGEWTLDYTSPLAKGTVIAALQIPFDATAAEAGSSELAIAGTDASLVTVTKAGTGSGTVTSTPAGINCGSTCSAFFDETVPVKLAGVADAGSGPVVWSGCDAVVGSNECEVTATAAKNVTATFDLTAVQPQPTVSNDPEGTVTTTSAVLNGHVDNEGDPAGSTCKFQVTTAADTVFGAPVKEVPCTTTPVTGTASEAVTATATGLTASTAYIYRVQATNGGGTANGTPAEDFTTSAAPPAPGPANLTIAKAGLGSGTVTCNGIACVESYPNETTVTLAATPAPGSTFAGWSGAGCGGTGTCIVVLTKDVAVTAAFDVAPPSDGGKMPSGGSGGSPGGNPPNNSTPPSKKPTQAEILKERRQKALARCKKLDGKAKATCVKQANQIGKPKKGKKKGARAAAASARFNIW